MYVGERIKFDTVSEIVFNIVIIAINMINGTCPVLG